MQIVSGIQTYQYKRGTAGVNGRQSFVRVPMANVRDCPRVVTDEDGKEHRIVRVVGWGAVADAVHAAWTGGKKSAKRLLDVVAARPKPRRDRDGNPLPGSDLVILHFGDAKDRFYEQAESDSSILPPLEDEGETIPF